MRRISTRRDNTSDTEDKLLRVLAPFGVWLALPVVGMVAWLLHWREGDSQLTPVLIAAGGIALMIWLNSITNERSRKGRAHQALTLGAGVAWTTFLTELGPSWTLGTLWFVLGIYLVVAWLIKYAVRNDSVEKAFPDKRAKSAKGKDKTPAVDVGYAVRWVASHLPWVRVVGERAGKVVPVLAAPWKQPTEIDAKTGTGEQEGPQRPGSADDPEALKYAHTVAEIFGANFKIMTRKNPQFNGTRLRWTDITSWRASFKLILPPLGGDLASELAQRREIFAKANRAALNRIIMRPNQHNAAEVLGSLIIQDTLATPTPWTPPQIGGSVGESGVHVGFYEDGAREEIFQPARVKITRSGGKIYVEVLSNLSHIGVEGAPGAGKSELARMIMAADVAFDDSEHWAIDCSKGAQTLGPVAPGLEWVAWKLPVAKKMVTWIVQAVIVARANYLASPGNKLGRPLDGWVPGCGLPFLRITIEEAGMIANELGDLYMLFNLARSAGVALILSLQRAQSGVLDTNVRSALGLIGSFGVKSMDDAFLLSDELSAAGADPSQWGKKDAGKHYLDDPEFEIERRLLATRTLKPQPELMREFVAEQGPRHRAQLRERFPDWYALLEMNDSRGIWAAHQSGDDLLASLEGVMGGLPKIPDAGKAADLSKPTAPKQAPDMTKQAQNAFGPDDGFGEDEDYDRYAADGDELEVALGEIDAELADVTSELTDEEKADLAELAGTLQGGKLDDDDLDGADELPDPTDEEIFARPADIGGLATEEAHYRVGLFLVRKHQENPEYTCTPAVLFHELGAASGAVGHSSGWYRDLVREWSKYGLLHQDAKGEPYTVNPALIDKIAAESVARGLRESERDAA